jgi:hypothetical protein
MRAETRQTGQDTWDWTAETCQPGQNSWDTSGGEENQDSATRTENRGRNVQNMTARKGQLA